MMQKILVRKYKKEDRGFIRKIACDTAFMGKPGELFWDAKESLADFLTLYFTDYEPESCFVAELDNRIIGYLIGAKNTVILRNIFHIRIIPRLLIKTILSGAVLRKKNLIFIFRSLLSFLKGEFNMPDFSKDYPATLHINIEENSRSGGVGSKLIATYLDYLIEYKIAGVHLATMSDKSGSFFERQGFALLYQSKKSYFRHILHRDITVYIYGKKLKLN